MDKDGSERHDEIGDDEGRAVGMRWACRRKASSCKLQGRQARDSRVVERRHGWLRYAALARLDKVEWRRASLGHAQCLALEDISQTHHRSFSARSLTCLLPLPPIFSPVPPIDTDYLTIASIHI